VTRKSFQNPAILTFPTASKAEKETHVLLEQYILAENVYCYCSIAGVFLDRKEAVMILREIYETCENLDETWVALMPPNADDIISDGYQLHIRTPKMQDFDRKCVEDILHKHGLKLKEITDTAIIYRPISG